MIALVAFILELIGVGFLVVATIGVLRFEDPFQRMHAATKTGTVGAGLVLAGTAFNQASLDATVIAVLTIVFLIATMPVAGHLLGRAFYISGAPLHTRRNALKGVLPRMEQPLEERQRRAFTRAMRRGMAQKKVWKRKAPVAEKTVRSAPLDQPSLREGSGALAKTGRGGGQRPDARFAAAGYDAVRFAVIAPEARRVARRAQALAAARSVPLIGVAVIDEGYLERPDADAREGMRARLAEAVAETRAAIAGSDVPLSLSYEEGDPLALIPGRDPAGREILLLPTDGWCHHGAPVTPSAGPMADKLFALAERHNGPTLFVGTAHESDACCIVVHDGSGKIQEFALWAMKTRLWSIETFIVVGPAAPEQIQALAAAAEATGARVVHRRPSEASAEALLPARHAGATAVILADLPQSGRVTTAGTFWQDRLIPGFRGDVLVG